MVCTQKSEPYLLQVALSRKVVPACIGECRLQLANRLCFLRRVS